MAFGWGSVAIAADGKQVVDSYGDIIEPADLESAVYEFVLAYNGAATGVGHEGPAVGRLVESLILTKEKAAAMGLGADTPEGWWVGLKIDDPHVFARVKSGELAMLSIQGLADTEEVS